jgi:hypothetical protein
VQVFKCRCPELTSLRCPISHIDADTSGLIRYQRMTAGQGNCSQCTRMSFIFLNPFTAILPGWSLVLWSCFLATRMPSAAWRSAVCSHFLPASVFAVPLSPLFLNTCELSSFPLLEVPFLSGCPEGLRAARPRGRGPLACPPDVAPRRHCSGSCPAA